jgi:hypothetical protein
MNVNDRVAISRNLNVRQPYFELMDSPQCLSLHRFRRVSFATLFEVKISTVFDVLAR